MIDRAIYIKNKLWKYAGFIEAHDKTLAEEFQGLMAEFPEYECKDCVSRKELIDGVNEAFSFLLGGENSEFLTFRKHQIVNLIEHLPCVLPSDKPGGGNGA